MTTESQKAFEEFARERWGAPHFEKKYTGDYNSLPVSIMLKGWQASEARIRAMLESEEMVEKITKLQASGWEYGTHPRTKAMIVLKAIVEGI